MEWKKLAPRPNKEQNLVDGTGLLPTKDQVVCDCK